MGQRWATHRGTTPFGSCFHQAIANVLEAQGLSEAPERIGLSWGFGWDGESAKLRSGDRWLAETSALHGLALERRRPLSWSAASAAEAAVLRRGVPVVVGVDSFEIESPYRGREHLVHALVVLERDGAGATVVDAMNRPEPFRLDATRYERARRASCVDRHVMYVSWDGPASPASDRAALASVGAGLERTRHDLGALDAYVAALPAFERSADVADVAAERLQLARLLGRAARSLPGLVASARAVASLSRRWYLAHTLVREARHHAPLRRGRLVSVLTDLRGREERELGLLSEALEQIVHLRGAGEEAEAT